MSRYEIPASQPYHRVVVGYDPPLGTFFAQVIDTTVPDTDARPVLWVGTEVGEVPTVCALAVALQDYAAIPAPEWEQLEREQQTIGFRPNFGIRLLHALRHAIKEQT